MKILNNITFSFILISIIFFSCVQKSSQKNDKVSKSKTAAEILGNPNYTAISYGGYREKTRDIQPTIAQIKEDMKLLQAMDIKFIRTYNVHLDETFNILKAITELKKEDPNFEMYLMLGAWIDCLDAWTDREPNHELESPRNEKEIKTAVKLAQQYPDIVKVIAVGNEAMVRWATSYFVRPNVILKWVNYLQDLKKKGELSKDLYITSSDDFASWGGGDPSYRVKDLEDLIKAVDYVSMHTYPYHNSHYNPAFWAVPANEQHLTDIEKVDAAMQRAIDFAKNQYKDVVAYVKSIDSTKQIHIGETGWASISDGHYGPKGSRASDEYKLAKYYKGLRDWTKANNISCFYFEAFDEKWKDSHNKMGSENHFGLINLQGEVKFPLWDLVDNGTFKNLKRDGKTLTKTFGGDSKKLLKTVQVPNIDYPR